MKSKTPSALSSAALFLTVLLTACGGGEGTSGGTPPSNDSGTYTPYAAATDPRSAAYLLQTDSSYLIPVNGTLEITLGRKSDTTGQISLPASYQLCSNSQGLSGAAVGTAGKFMLTMNRFNTATYVWLGPADSCATRLPGYGYLRVKPEGSLKWERATGANIYFSNPAIGVNGNVHIGSDDGLIYTFTPAGIPLWIGKTAARIYGGSPVVDTGTHGTVYIGSFDKNLYAYDFNGVPLWKFATTSQLAFAPALNADGTMTLVGSDGKIYNLNRDGTQNSVADIAGSVTGAPVIAQDGTLYIVSVDYKNGNGHKLSALRPDGTVKWTFTAGNDLGTPAIGADGTLYVGSRDSNLYAIRPDGTKKWAYFANVLQGSPVIAADGTVYIGSLDGNLYAVNPDGTKKWTVDTGYSTNLDPRYYKNYGRESASITTAPTVGKDGTIYVGCSNGTLFAFNPDGTQRWADAHGIDVNPDQPNGAPIFTSPALAPDGTLYYAYGGYVRALSTLSQGLADSPWPHYQRNSQNTGR
ncbi:PQQ-binding-like beta-propeller repeat protein (plasmid) [Deinococcus radiomollis]|uniref:outer membrane protein assembly factor BamB family protein n=1 Tax=Deinococcus radiomollis TaxID=468916 RepID=UPI003892C4CA